MSREELQALLDQAPIIDSEKIETMDRFSNELALVNEQWSIMYAELGTELIPVVEELLPLIQDYGIPAIAELTTILEYAGRGFHIMGAEAKIAYEILNNRDLDAARKEMQDLQSWMQATQTADALKAAGYTSGAYWEGSKWVKPTKPGGEAPEVTNAAAAKRVQDEYLDSVDWTTKALRDYRAAVDDVADAQERLNDISQDYADQQIDLDRKLSRDAMLVNPRDPRAVMELNLRHQWAEEDAAINYTRASNKQTAAVTEAQGVAAGKAATLGQAALSQAGIVIQGPIYVNGDKSFEKVLNDIVQTNGIPTRSSYT
jgi:hypothetical protein